MAGLRLDPQPALTAISSPRTFCSPFDDALAHRGPGAVFRLDREGLLRFDPEWTRDAWGRVDLASVAPGREAGPTAWRWILARDRDSGFVQLVLSTHPGLLAEHPRLQLRSFDDAGAAEASLTALGRPPVVSEPW